MTNSDKVSSGLSVDDRCVIARVIRIEGPRASKYSGEYYTVRWQLPEDMCGHTDISSEYSNYRLWKTWLEVAEPDSYWVVVVHDDLKNSTPEDVLIDADYRAYDAESL